MYCNTRRSVYTSLMDYTSDNLLAEINSFLREHKISAYTLGIKSSKDGRLVERLRAGGDIGTRKAQKIRDWMRTHESPCREAT